MSLSLFLGSEDLALRQLFQKVAKYWAPKLRSKKSLELPEVEDSADQSKDSTGVSGAVEDEIIDGDTTPDSKPTNDEYLAWTLGGSLRENSPWAKFCPGSPEDMSTMADEIDIKLKELETLGLK